MAQGIFTLRRRMYDQRSGSCLCWPWMVDKSVRCKDCWRPYTTGTTSTFYMLMQWVNLLFVVFRKLALHYLSCVNKSIQLRNTNQGIFSCFQYIVQPCQRQIFFFTKVCFVLTSSKSHSFILLLMESCSNFFILEAGISFSRVTSLGAVVVQCSSCA